MLVKNYNSGVITQQKIFQNLINFINDLNTKKKNSLNYALSQTYRQTDVYILLKTPDLCFKMPSYSSEKTSLCIFLPSDLYRSVNMDHIFN